MQRGWRWWWENLLVFKEEEIGEHESSSVAASKWRAMGDSRSRNWMNLTEYIKDHLCLFLCTELAWTLLRWLSMWLDFCVFLPSQKLCQALSLLFEIYQLLSISLSCKSSNKGKNPLEAHESWYCVLRWIRWHCCGLLCKYTSVDFVEHKLCKCSFRDSSKCRLLAWCLETINISDVNLYSETAML